jgi:hypothetical protein
MIIFSGFVMIFPESKVVFSGLVASGAGSMARHGLLSPDSLPH